jgi:hypothetical protein
VTKLLCKDLGTGGLTRDETHAVLSQRLALDINMPQYLFSANPDSAKAMMDLAHDQIANHMRVCVALETGIESLCGIASSEPILSEAASKIMRNEELGFSLCRALSQVLNGYCVDQGERGELIVSSFFAWARDQVVRCDPAKDGQLCPYFSVNNLFDQLFTDTSILDKGGPSIYPSGADTEKPFKEVFENAKMHFNHLIKPRDQKSLKRKYLLFMMARGAAALGANCQPGFDAVYPYLYGSTNLDISKSASLSFK